MEPFVVAGRQCVLRVFDAGLACCAVECAAAMRRDGGPSVAGGRKPAVHVLVVAGTVTDRLAPHVLRAYEAMPAPRRVLSFGACSNSGGPYWDSYSVTKGVDQLIPVDVYVPGCPPRPEALLHGLQELLETVGGGPQAASAGAAGPEGRPGGVAGREGRSGGRGGARESIGWRGGARGNRGDPG